MNATAMARLEPSSVLRRWWVRFLERTMPWYDPRGDAVRRADAERFRRRSIATRIALEDVAKRYEKHDHVVR